MEGAIITKDFFGEGKKNHCDASRMAVILLNRFDLIIQNAIIVKVFHGDLEA
ncbi:MAG: hypothetical protein Q4Q28_05385 [Bacteroidales bacterium]|nr:hypothetical protein [Bacteroidales bacterium]